MNKRWLSTLGWVALLTPVYIGAGEFGLSHHLTLLNSSVSPIWPPTGLALATMLLLGYRVWPAIFIGAFYVNWDKFGQVSPAIGPAIVIALGNTSEALLGTMLARRFARGTDAFELAPDIFRYFFFAAIPSTALSATVGVTTLVVHGSAAWDSFAPVWMTWWTGDLVSDLVLAPLIIVWGTRGISGMNWQRAAEAAALVVLLLGVSAANFAPWEGFSGTIRVVARLSLPLLLWAAFRFHQRGASAASVIMGAVAVYGTLKGSGPLYKTATDVNDALVQLQAFMGSNALTLLVLAAVVAERARVAASLAHNQLRLTAAFDEEQKLLQREQAARADAERANRAKDDFLAVLSHELRTPLTPVMLTASLLENSPSLPPEIRDDVESIRRNVELEARLIDDLLDLTRITRGKLQLDLKETDVHEVVGRAIDICCRGGAVGVEVRLDAPHHHVRADPARMHQVFWNLLSNARKFTPDGGTISVRSLNHGTDAAPSIVLEVADTGVGIEPELLPRLFTAFEQGESPRARRAGGLGLGLAISKALVEAHGGTLTASSDGAGRGAVFLVQLPVSSNLALPAGSANGQPVAAAAARSLKILLVEDHPATLLAMKRLLGTMGHQVSTATTVASAVDVAGREEFELIISDLGLPDGLGYDIMQSVSGRGAIRGIALSGYGMPADIERSRVSGFSEHLTKPVDLEVLEAAISRVTSANFPAGNSRA